MNKRFAAMLLAILLAWTAGIQPGAADAAGDTRPPVLVHAGLSDRTITLQYDESLDESSVPVADSFYVKAGGQQAAVEGVAISGSAVMVTLAQAPDVSGVILLTYLRGQAGIADLSGNEADNLIERSVARPDSEPPVLLSAAVGGGQVVLAYNETLDPASVPSLANLYVKVNGSIVSAQSVDIGGAEVRITLAAAPLPGQTVVLTYIKGVSAIRDTAGNPAANLLDRPVSNPVSITAPILVSVSASGDRVVLTYNKNLNPLSVPAADSFLVESGAGVIAVASVAVGGPSVTLRLSAAAAPGEAMTFSYFPPSVGALRTTAGVPAPAADAFPVDNQTDGSPPALIGAAWSGSQLRLRYSEELLASSVPPASSFTVRRGSTEIGVASVELEGETVVLTLQSAIAAGSAVTVSYAAPDSGPLTDASGNTASNLFNQPVADSGDLSVPVLTGAFYAGPIVTLTYNETLSPASVPGADSFQVVAGGSSRNVTAVAISGAEVKLTLSAAETGSSALTVTYAPPASAALQDLNGNRAAAIASFPAGNASDKSAPSLSSATANGTRITLTFGETLRQQPVPPASSFIVAVDGEIRQINSVSLQGSVVTLTIGTAVAVGQAVTVSYTPGTDGLRDLSSNAAAPFAGRSATNQTDVTPPVLATSVLNGLSVVLTYNELLDTASVPPASSFSLNGGGYLTVSGVAVAGRTVTLALGGTPQSTSGVTLNYYPSYGNAIKDQSGNQAAALYNQSLGAGSDLTAPVLSSASASDNRIAIEYNEDLDSASVPASSQFIVRTTDQRQLQVSGVSVSGRTVTLTMAAALQPGSTLTVSYSGSSVRDPSGNASAAVSGHTVTVAGNAFSFTGASAAGTTVTLSFNSRLKTAPVPAPSEFRVTADGRPIAVSSVSIDGAAIKLQLSGSGIRPGQTATVSYSPGESQLQDEWGAFISAFQDRPVSVEGEIPDGPGDGSGNATPGGKGASAAAYDLEWTAAQSDVSYDTAGGQTSAVYRIKTDAVGSLESLKGRPSPNVRIAAQGSETSVTAFIPATAFAAKSMPGGLRFTFETEKGSMVVPADWIDAGGLAKQFKTELERLAVGFSIGEAAPGLAQEVAGALKEEGMQEISAPITYEVFIEADGKRYQMSAFNQYLNRKIRLSAPVSLKDTTIVRFDRQTRKLEYVPAIFANADANTHAVIKHMRTGTYAVVRNSGKFTDMDNHWAKTEVGYLASKLLIEGRTDDTFEPGRSMSKAEFVTLLVRALGLADLSDSLPYKDVSEDSWYRPYMGAAYSMRIIDGGSAFQPDKPVTRAEIALMTYRAVQIAGRQITLTDIDNSAAARFNDIGGLNPASREAVAAVVKSGIIGGSSDSTFAPQANATRAEAAVILGRMLRYVGYLNA